MSGIARNHLRNFIRKRREELVGGSEDLQALLESRGEPAEGLQPSRARMDALGECLDKLPESARSLLNQRYVLGKSVREISGDSERGYSALTMQFHRLREILAACITRKLEQEKA